MSTITCCRGVQSDKSFRYHRRGTFLKFSDMYPDFPYLLLKALVECTSNQVIIKSGLVSLDPEEIFEFSWYMLHYIK